jgi:UDP-N-acetylmuramoylalanine--D-glutamate ligase
MRGGDTPARARPPTCARRPPQRANALAALALCEGGWASRRRPVMLPALRDFRGCRTDVELVAVLRRRRAFYDDSKGTNVGATVAALAGLGPLVLIAGGDGKGQDFSPLAPVRAHARAVLLIGRDAAGHREALADCGVPLSDCADLEDACARRALAQPGDAVLLSPACASLDMFRNYGHRAEVFIARRRWLRTRDAVLSLRLPWRASQARRRSRPVDRAALPLERANSTSRCSGTVACCCSVWSWSIRPRSPSPRQASPAYQPAYFLMRHAVFLCIGIAAAWSLSRCRCGLAALGAVAVRGRGGAAGRWC